MAERKYQNGTRVQNCLLKVLVFDSAGGSDKSGEGGAVDGIQGGGGGSCVPANGRRPYSGGGETLYLN